MNFTRTHFDPSTRGTSLGVGRVVYSYPPGATPDKAESSYVYDESLVLAVNVALATGRPLLLAGEPGSGKTTLARNIALCQDWAYYAHTIASRSQAADLLYTVDTLARLNDAQQKSALAEEQYVEPGVLWWVLAPASAALRGLPVLAEGKAAPRPPLGHRASGGAVLLIDEIDKAEPDVPNDLLEVLDTASFSVKGRPVGREPTRSPVLVIVTTNVERDLPGAFMRRCVTYRFPDAAPGWFAQIGRQRHPKASLALAQRLEARLRTYRDAARERTERVPGTAEYIDALAALVELKIDGLQADAGQAAWDQIEQCVFGKQAAIEGMGRGAA